MAEAGLQEAETYVSRRQNTVAKYIVTRPIMNLCLAEKRNTGPRVVMRWCEQEVLDLEGMLTAGWDAEQTEKLDQTDVTDNATATDDWLSGEDTVVTITLGTEPNAPLAYALGL